MRKFLIILLTLFLCLSLHAEVVSFQQNPIPSHTDLSAVSENASQKNSQIKVPDNIIHSKLDSTKKVLSDITDSVSKSASSLTDRVKSIPNSMLERAKMMNGIPDKVSNTLGSVGSSLKGLFSKATEKIESISKQVLKPSQDLKPEEHLPSQQTSSETHEPENNIIEAPVVEPSSQDMRERLQEDIHSEGTSSSSNYDLDRPEITNIESLKQGQEAMSDGKPAEVGNEQEDTIQVTESDPFVKKSIASEITQLPGTLWGQLKSLGQTVANLPTQVVNKVKEVKEEPKSVVNSAGNIFSRSAESLKSQIKAVSERFSQLTESVKSSPRADTEGVETVSENSKGSSGSISETAGESAKSVSSKLLNQLNNVKQRFMDLPSSLSEKISKFAEKVTSSVNSSDQESKSIVPSFVKNFAEGVRSKTKNLFAKTGQVAKEASSKFDISRAFHRSVDYLKDRSSIVAQSISGKFDYVKSKFNSQAVKSVANWLGRVKDAIKAPFSYFWDAVISFRSHPSVINFYQGVKNFKGKLIDTVLWLFPDVQRLITIAKILGCVLVAILALALFSYLLPIITPLFYTAKTALGISKLALSTLFTILGWILPKSSSKPKIIKKASAKESIAKPLVDRKGEDSVEGIVERQVVAPKEGERKSLNRGSVRCYGYYECLECKRTWESSDSYSDMPQRCRNCGVDNTPYHTIELTDPKKVNKSAEGGSRGQVEPEKTSKKYD